MLPAWFDPERAYDESVKEADTRLRELNAVRASPSWWRLWRSGRRAVDVGVILLLVGLLGGVLSGWLLKGPAALAPMWTAGSGMVIGIAGGLASNIALARALRDAESRRAPPAVEASA